MHFSLVSRLTGWASHVPARGWQILGGLLAVGVVCTAGYFGYRSSHQELEQAPPAPATIPVERGDVELSVTAPGQVVDAGERAVQAQVSGTVEDLLVKPGEAVHAGQVLAHLGPREKFEQAVAAAQMQVLEAQIELDKVDYDLILSQAEVDLVEAQKKYDAAQQERESKIYQRSSQETVDIARANYVLAQNAVTQAEIYYDNFDGLPEDNSMRAEAFSQLAAARQKRDSALANLNWLLGKPDAQEIAAADAHLSLAKQELEKAERIYELIKKGQAPEVGLAEARLNDAQAALKAAQSDLDSLEVKAPYDGVIVEAAAEPGQATSPGMELLSLIRPEELEAQTTVVEEDLPLIEPGQPAQLFVDALPDQDVTGAVSRIIPKRASGDRALYIVYLSLDAIPEHLVSGMTIDASIVIDRRQDVLRLPLSAVRSRPDGTAEIEIWQNGQIEKRQVKTGLKGDSYVEILEGLSEGDAVVTR
ncbi:MAG: efflux RND transporter periplasmic adaptor subunit [Anaerolineaceae bacterium]|nr:efflux RND transporter periplasmic adaptor subunit [Anaerolineaceae bacterium]